MKRKLAKLLIAVMAIEILFSNILSENEYGRSRILEIIAEATDLKTASPLNTLKQEQRETTAALSQAKPPKQ